MCVIRVLILPPVVSGVIFGVSCPACQHLNAAKRTKEVSSSYWLGMAATALQSYHTSPWNITGSQAKHFPWTGIQASALRKMVRQQRQGLTSPSSKEEMNMQNHINIKNTRKKKFLVAAILRSFL